MCGKIYRDYGENKWVDSGDWYRFDGNGWGNGKLWEMVIKWGLIKGCGSVSATPAFAKTRNPYFLIIYPLSIEFSDNFALAVIPIEY